MKPGRGTLWAKRASLASALLFTLASPARAVCLPPDPLLIWSYPEAGSEVPLDAHVWALVPDYIERLTVALDGEPLPRVVPAGERDVSPLQRAEYAPAARLAPGEHELTITIGESEEWPFAETYRSTFVAREQDVPGSAFAITSATEYREGPEGNPRGAPAQCDGQLIDTRLPCYDTGYPRVHTRVTLEHDAKAIAYLVADRLVPASCDTFDLVGWANADELVVTAVLANGLSEPRPFEGEVARIGGEDFGCSLAAGGAGSEGAMLALGALAASAFRRRCRRTSARRGRRAWLALTTGLSAAAALWASSAHADCGPAPAVQWTYPDASTNVVPSTSHLWVFVPERLSSSVTVTLDGERIQRVHVTGSTPLERAEYAPNEPLSPGEHELVIDFPDIEQVPPLEGRRIPFVVGEGSTREVRAEIASITRYAWEGPGRLGYRSAEPFPPEADYEGDCTERLVDTSEGCNDIIDDLAGSLRIELDSNGEAIANLVGQFLVPGDCRVLFPYGYAAYAQEYSLTPVLPEGALSARPFEGEVEVVEGRSTVYDVQGPGGWCSLGSVGGAPGSAAALFAALGVGGVLVSRRRARARRSP